MFVYVGSRTTQERRARGEGLSVYRLDAARGDLQRVQLVGGLVNPSFLALGRGGDRLYVVHGDREEVSAFAIDAASGQLSLLNRQLCGGLNPVHLAVSPSGRELVVTNHIGASVVVLPVDERGALGPVVQRLVFDGPLGPHRVEQTQAKPHFSPFDRSGRWVLVPDKGLDRVYSFAFDNGRLRPAARPWVAAREGAGPRNLVQHPGRDLVYVVNELDSTVTTCALDAADGGLTPLQVVSALPDCFTGNSRASSVAVDAAGRTLYVSNRGHDSVAALRIHPHTGLLSGLRTVPSGGRTPRFFTLSPCGAWLFALNEDSDSICRFAVDADTGGLTPDGLAAACGSPVCMVFGGVGA